MMHIRAGQHSSAGTKSTNEDSCGIRIPEQPALTSKGAALVIADGMSGSDAGKEASDCCVRGFLSDYYSTPESWSVKTSAQKVLGALNRWLHGQGQHRFGSERGMVSTLSVLVLKSATAHLFHVGDTRIYRLRANELECLTRDHQVRMAGNKAYLARALGIDVNVEIDYRTVPLEVGDIFLLTTDGIHGSLSEEALAELVKRDNADPQLAARDVVAAALDAGSRDNMTCQLVYIDALPHQNEEDFYRRLTELPFPPPLEPGMTLDGYRVLRELHASKRTQVYLALDASNATTVVLKTPSVIFQDDPVYIERFLHEEWVGRRLRNPHVLRVLEPEHNRHFLYYVTEHVEGQTLRQWMHDHPRPDLASVRNIVAQIATGLRAFHRMEMLHQDMKPENILIDRHGTVKIIDFGSTKIAGVEEIATPLRSNDDVLGTRNYTAPEYLQGYAGSNRSDIYSLATLAYELLSGKLPYGEELSVRRLNRARYVPLRHWNADVPAWFDGALERALQIDPAKRHADIAELVYDLSHPNPALTRTQPLPLLERNPAGFWRALTLLLLAINLILAYFLGR